MFLRQGIASAFRHILDSWRACGSHCWSSSIKEGSYFKLFQVSLIGLILVHFKFYIIVFETLKNVEVVIKYFILGTKLS